MVEEHGLFPGVQLELASDVQFILKHDEDHGARGAHLLDLPHPTRRDGPGQADGDRQPAPRLNAILVSQALVTFPGPVPKHQPKPCLSVTAPATRPPRG